MFNTCAQNLHVPHKSRNFRGVGSWAGCLYSSKSIESFEFASKTTWRDRGRVCAKFEMPRRFRGLNMNHKKNPRQCRCLALAPSLDSSIPRFTNSLGSTHTHPHPHGTVIVIHSYDQQVLGLLVEGIFAQHWEGGGVGWGSPPPYPSPAPFVTV
jgi:hypothetical protein